jgi:hypothetical protein
MITTHAKRFALSTAILAACAAGGAAAADTDVHKALAPCIGISSSADRLACYDKLAGRVSAPQAQRPSAAAAEPVSAAAAPASATAAPASTTAAPASAAPVAAAAAPAAAPTVEDFGLSKVQKAAVSGASSPPKIKSISAKVAAFGRSSNRRTQITLDNGQVWEYQDDPDSLLSVGDSVTIERATLGSFLLVTPTKLSNRVRRIS